MTLPLIAPPPIPELAEGLDQAFRQYPHAVYLLDTDRRFVRVNDKAVTEFGLAREALLGRPSESLLCPEYRDHAAAHWARALAGEAVRYDARALGPDGRFDVRLVLVPIRQGNEVSAVLGVAENTSEQRALQRRLERLALQDGLTGLANRARLEEHLERAVARAERAKVGFAVLYFDIDRFKQVNDTLGHEAGDQVIREVARRASGSVRRTDLVARLGGDEFVVVLDGATRPGAVRKVAETLRAAIATPLGLADGGLLEVGTSIGGALYAPGLGARELLRQADSAMYAAKRSGRGRVVIGRIGGHRPTTKP